MRSGAKPKTALNYVLLALVPYSRPNMLLAFKPKKFFTELEQISNYSEASLREAYNRGKRRGLIVNESEAIVKLTRRGLIKVQPFVAEKLPGNASLMVIFDIPEQNSSVRTSLRRLLKSWQFKQVQKVFGLQILIIERL